MDNFKKIHIEDVDLVFFDLETTGLSPANGDTICEMGAVKVRNGREVGEFNTLVNPRREIPQEVSEIHGIYDSDVAKAPYFGEVVDRFLYFINNSILCGYNIGFDLGFLNSELAKINYLSIELPSFDVLLMARRTFKDLTKYNLRFLADYLHVEASRFHRALDDARATKDIFVKIKNILSTRGIDKAQDFLTLYGFGNTFFKKNQEPKYLLIQESIMTKVPMRIQYVSEDSRLCSFMVIPEQLKEDRGAIYLVGTHCTKKTRTELNFSRILRAEVV